MHAASSILVRTACLFAAALLAAACDDPEPAGDFGSVPSFHLRDAQGREITLTTFSGKVWIADFIFTSCPDVCPLLTEQLAAVRKRLARHDARLAYASFSVDPEHDTPQKLGAFAAAHGAVAPNWYFLTGANAEVTRVVKQGFKQAMEAEPEAPGRPRNVLHGTHFVLVDAAGKIRGFYRSDEEGMDELVSATERLVSEVQR